MQRLASRIVHMPILGIKTKNPTLWIVYLLLLLLFVSHFSFKVPDSVATDNKPTIPYSSNAKIPYNASAQVSDNKPTIPYSSNAKIPYNASAQVSVSIIVIVSEQRSSSTFLSHDILAKQSCHLSLNEVLFKDQRQSGDAWEIEGKELGLNKGAFGSDPTKIASLVPKVAIRRCRQMLEKREKPLFSTFTSIESI